MVVESQVAELGSGGIACFYHCLYRQNWITKVLPSQNSNLQLWTPVSLGVVVWDSL